MKHLKRLSRNELKVMTGGAIIDGPKGSGLPTEGGNYKCCSNNSDACSACVYIKTNPVCSSGSYPVAC